MKCGFRRRRSAAEMYRSAAAFQYVSAAASHYCDEVRRLNVHSSHNPGENHIHFRCLKIQTLVKPKYINENCQQCHIDI